MVTIAPPIAHADIRLFAEDRINLPADLAKERRQKVNDLRERLGRWMQEHPECGIAKSYISGSLAKGTALKTSSDVDVALYIKYDGQKKADRKLADWIADRLRKAYPQMKPEQIEPQDYAASALPTLSDPVQIFDPVNPKNNVASQYTEENRRLIVNAAQDALDALNEAHTASIKGHAVEMWRVVLGPSFRG